MNGQELSQELVFGSPAWVEARNRELEEKTPQEILRFALASFDPSLRQYGHTENLSPRRIVAVDLIGHQGSGKTAQRGKTARRIYPAGSRRRIDCRTEGKGVRLNFSIWKIQEEFSLCSKNCMD